MAARAVISRGDRSGRLWPALGLLVCSALGLIGLQAYEVLTRSSELARARELVSHTFEVINTAQNLRASLQNAERGLRGYLLTAETDFLAPYRKGLEDVPALLMSMARLTVDNPLQQSRIPQLQRQIQSRLDLMRETVAAYDREGLDAARQIVRGNSGLDLMRSTEATIDEIVATEDSLLTDRVATVTQDERAEEQLAIVSGLFASMLMVLGILSAGMAFSRARRLQTELERQAREGTEMNRTLQERNFELAKTTEHARQAREEANRANMAKSRFLSTASHDLRQPLQTLSLLNGTLRRIVRETEAAEALIQQEDAIGTMSRLLNALLDISKVERGAVKPEPADFAVFPLMEMVTREFRAVAVSKGLQFRVEECIFSAHSDPALVEQIVRNLVSNAIKYTTTGGVTLRCRRDEAFAFVHIEVVDTGVGIPAEHIPYICGEFYQVGVSTNSTREGYGLGLAIVQRLIKLLDLELEVKSVAGKGSTFSVRLPAGSKELAARSPASESTPVVTVRPAKPRVLLVEDDPAVRDATRLLLKVEGYNVTSVASRAEVLQKIGELTELSLLVTDMHLGDGETGLQVIAAVRAALNRPLKAILITGDTSAAIKDLPHDPGLRVASKPIKADALLALMSSLLAA
jgi:two-component system, sensor histidine kinase